MEFQQSRWIAQSVRMSSWKEKGEGRRDNGCRIDKWWVGSGDNCEYYGLGVLEALIIAFWCLINIVGRGYATKRNSISIKFDSKTPIYIYIILPPLSPRRTFPSRLHNVTSSTQAPFSHNGKRHPVPTFQLQSISVFVRHRLSRSSKVSNWRAEVEWVGL